MANKILLRRATEIDLPLMMAWRSNPLIYQGFYQQKEVLKWEEHLGWWGNRNKDWRTFLIIFDGRPIGVVTVGQLDHWNPEIGLYLGEVTLWNKGIGTQALLLAIKWLEEYARKHSHVVECHSTILDSNKASQRVFKKCGFKWMAVARKNESWYNRTLEGNDATIQRNKARESESWYQKRLT